MEWYKGELRGYEIVNEGLFNMSTPEGVVEWGFALFKKGDEGVGIWALSGTPIADNGKSGVVYCVITGDIRELMGEVTTTTTPSGLPPSDLASGEEPLPRYPGSVMLAYEKIHRFPLAIMIDYGTNAGMNEVANWYKAELGSRGWELKEERSYEGTIKLYFVKQREEVGVAIYAPTSEVSYTTIYLTYESYELPSSDLVSGEEPISRYPGSVILNYTSLTIDGAKYITINYGTYDEAAAVASWYKDYLRNNGWMLVLEEKEDERLILTFYKEGESAAVRLTISANAYTNIEVFYHHYRP